MLARSESTTPNMSVKYAIKERLLPWLTAKVQRTSSQTSLVVIVVAMKAGTRAKGDLSFRIAREVGRRRCTARGLCGESAVLALRRPVNEAAPSPGVSDVTTNLHEVGRVIKDAV